MKCTFILLSLLSFSGVGCELTMGYRTSERLPYIHAEPDNSGLFDDLYRTAAARIGCELNIVRAPKNRIIRDLMHGKIDFYPSLGFNRQRMRFAHFVPNGLPERYTGISREGTPDIRQPTELVNHDMVLLISPGGYDLGGLPDKLETRRPPDMDVPQALGLLRARKGDFFIYDEITLNYYLKRDGRTALKLHHDCCESPRTMYLGFSRKSPHFDDEPNPAYDVDKPLTPENLPRRLRAGTKAEQFSRSLALMLKEGKTQALIHSAALESGAATQHG